MLLLQDIELKSKSIHGDSTLITTYSLPVIPGSIHAGKVITAHPERLYAFVLGWDQITIAQNYTFDPLTPPIDYFLGSTNVEK